MPSNRKRTPRAALELNAHTMWHLLDGGLHLLAMDEGECEVCNIGIMAMREKYYRHRKEILRYWPDPFPCFADCIYEGAELPEKDPRPGATAPQREFLSYMRGIVAEYKEVLGMTPAHRATAAAIRKAKRK